MADYITIQLHKSIRPCIQSRVGASDYLDHYSKISSIWSRLMYGLIPPTQMDTHTTLLSHHRSHPRRVCFQCYPSASWVITMDTCAASLSKTKGKDDNHFRSHSTAHSVNRKSYFGKILPSSLCQPSPETGTKILAPLSFSIRVFR